VGKKAAFITQAAGALRLKNAKAVHARIEAIAGQFDVIASRAFSSLPELVGATRHMLAESGSWMAMKGKTPDEEIAQLGRAVSLHVEPLTVPQMSADRCVVWIERPRKRAPAHEQRE
jgi:16S rRNA (guanine527-N7)-methyltransferase